MTREPITNTHVRFLVAGVSLIFMFGPRIACCAEIAGATVPKSAQTNVIVDYSGEIPFTAAELWTRVEPLLAKTNGYIEGSELESVLRVKMNSATVDGGLTNYFLIAKKDWYLDINLMQLPSNFKNIPHRPGGKQSRLTVNFRNANFSGGSFGGCLPRELVEKDLIDLGWTEFRLPVRQDPEDQFEKGGLESFVESYNDLPHGIDCVLKISIAGRPK